MQTKLPKDTPEISWTKHAAQKMRYYGISESRVKKVLKNPKRIEEGIAPNTVALMQPLKTKRSQEIWVMYQKLSSKLPPSLGSSPKTTKDTVKLRWANKTQSSKLRIISVWRYPGVSPLRKPIFIPEDTIQESGL
jgi:hypothetical protein